MTEASTHFPRWLGLLASVARWALAGVLTFWLLLALAWAGLHFWIVPRIDNFRPLLQERAQRLLGVDVRVQRLSARSEGVFPTIELDGVQLLDAQGQEALRLPRVVITLSPRSVLRLGLQQLYVEAPRLQLRRDAAGRLFVAGLPVQGAAGDASALDWLLSQAEVVVRGGEVQWLDEQRALPAVVFDGVDLVLRGGPWRHALRVDATPPASWGDRLSLRAQLQEPLWDPLGRAWTHWSGQWYAEWPHVDLAQLAPHVDLRGMKVDAGQGALRAWADMRQGRLERVVSDVALRQVRMQWSRALQPLALDELGARVTLRPLPGGLDLSARDLHFLTDDGLAWQSGSLALRTQGTGAAQHGELRADVLDLALLTRIATRVPLDRELREALERYTPEGRVQQLQASWQGAPDALTGYSAKGRVSALALAANAADCSPKAFGLRGAAGSFELTQAGGSASLSIADGALLLPGVFEDPCVPVQTLGATVRWQIDGARIAVQSDDLRFANADAQGQARLHWHTGEGDEAYLPGVLDLSGSLTRADGTRVYRYLPLAVGDDARHYVRDAITAGTSSDVKFRVKGDLRHLPFDEDRSGEFHIAAQVRDTTLVYVPPALAEPGDKPWPALAGLSGSLVFDRAGMRVEGATGHVQGAKLLKVQQVSARIADLSRPLVEVQGDVRGPLADMLSFVRGSQVAQLTEGMFDAMTGTGDASLRLQLRLPIEAMAKSQVQGRITLSGNEVRVAREAPALTQTRGVVKFSERGFELEQVRAQALGGEVQLSGGLRPQVKGAVPQLRIQADGAATAEGLRQAAAGDRTLAALAARSHGASRYALTLGVREGVPELLVTTDLQGMALDLPAPLAKPADQALPVRYETRLLASTGKGEPARENLRLTVGGVFAFNYLRAISADGAGVPPVLAGTIVLGPGVAAQPMGRGVQAHVALQTLDLDAWSALAGGSSAAPPSPWEPRSVDLRVGALTWKQRTLHDVVAQAQAQDKSWSAQVSARELEGRIAYRAPDAAAPQGLVHARLSRLALPRTEETQVDALLDEGDLSELPALDVQAQDFELRGKRLGRLTLQANNRVSADGQREWRLSSLNLEMPEASFTSSGNWALLGNAGPNERRRTVLKFALKVRDSGELLTRMGMPGVVSRGAGELDGQIGWLGSPVTPDYASMTGQMKLDMTAGQFLKADPGISKLLGVLSLQALPRRLTLDFRDIFSAGFSFDFVRADVQVDKGIARTNNLQMKGVNAAVLMEGHADIANETEDLHVVVVPQLNTLTASLIATVINPVVGLSSFLAQAVLGDKLVKAATREFRIEGTWSDPQVTQIEPGGADAPTGKGDTP
ncbi:MAG: TIGR02099 family protein [Comamonas sp. SCN 67-35]|uniref:YhdP family protein n=1 Tax=unclassified Comamonas TaxID=2638500 RepID=UPI000869CBD6|nr:MULTISPECIES: YhdP family protein [unclassified Comamonas]MBN9329053.1 TIGR02099 family protein [Comamonas sp.]ODU38739.1 MAG: TIGR02099 family protein [Comamonas sp. SCN 67-35]OJX01838.1 MAG: TIGR02099 family protein [Burkholderiales bacterium 66-26]